MISIGTRIEQALNSPRIAEIKWIKGEFNVDVDVDVDVDVEKKCFDEL